MSRIVMALGGNALGTTYLEQQELIKITANQILPLINGNELVITHGNGPQVGMISAAFLTYGTEMPLDISTAMSQGYIGFHLLRELKKVLDDNSIDREVISLISEVFVDSNDPLFRDPTKPIGKFYTKEEAEKKSLESGDIYLEDAGRGYRKVVASPKPLEIKNLLSLEALLNNKSVVITTGGGGIPVFKDKIASKVDAVIDKDLTSSLLAMNIGADLFIILTAVNQVMIGFDTDNPQKINSISTSDVRKHINRNEFKAGSMLPKIEAALEFTEKTGNKTIITSLENVSNVLNEVNVTVIYKG